MLETTPDKVTLGDWQAANGSIFSYLIDTAQVQYLGDTDADTMDFLLASMFSQRKVRSFFENLSAQEVGKHIHKVYSDSWQHEFDLFQQVIALEGEAVATAEDTSTANTTRSTSTNQVNKTSGFDGTELVDDNGADISGTDSTDNTASNTNKSINKTQAGLVAKARVLREQRFHERICEDIAQFITLSIY